MFKQVILCETGGYNIKFIKNIPDVYGIIKSDLYKAPVELVGGDNSVKPYFDFDPLSNDDFDTDLFVMDCKQNIQILFDLPDDKDIRYVNRIYKKNDKTKYSYHFIVDNNRISYFNIPVLIKKKGMQEQFKDLDNSVYSKNRGLYPIYSSVKRTTDKNNPYITLPEFKPDNDNTDISKYLVSYIEEDFKDWDVFFPKKETKPEKQHTNDDMFSKALNLSNNKCDDDELKFVRKLVFECLSYTRAENYNDWINLGFCLHNIDYRLIDVWDQFSKYGSTYTSGKCQELWDKMKDGQLKIGTLKYWAKLDNKYKYEELVDEQIAPFVDKCIRSDGAHSDVAEVISIIFKDKVVYDTKVKSWYIVNGKTNIWEQDKEGVKVRMIISTLGCNVFIKRTQYWNTLECDDELKNQVNGEKAKRALKIAGQLKNAGFKDSIMKELKSWCIQDNFIEQYLDSNINLFAFQNGVYDLENNTFRDIEPTDYISTTTGYDYNPKIDDCYINTARDFLKSTQESDVMYQYVLDVLSCMLYGKNYHQDFHIFNGKGANGKSVLMTFLLLTFGKYGTKINATTFTKPSRGANETSEMHDCKASRLIVVEEPEETDALITSRLKEFSGDGKIKTRGLHENAFSFDPQFGIIFFCNQIPTLSKVDKAIGRRLRLVDFPNTFCDNPTKPNEKLINKNLNTLFKDNIGYRQAFSYLLLQNWKNRNLYKGKLETPVEVMKVTNEYMDDCNEVKKFINENYEITKEKTDLVSSRELYTYFKQKTGSKMDEKSFAYNMDELEVPKKRVTAGCKYIGIKEKNDEDE